MYPQSENIESAAALSGSSSSTHDGTMAEFEFEIVQIAVSAGLVDHLCNEATLLRRRRTSLPWPLFQGASFSATRTSSMPPALRRMMRQHKTACCGVPCAANQVSSSFRCSPDSVIAVFFRAVLEDRIPSFYCTVISPTEHQRFIILPMSHHLVPRRSARPHRQQRPPNPNHRRPG